MTWISSSNIAIFSFLPWSISYSHVGLLIFKWHDVDADVIEQKNMTALFDSNISIKHRDQTLSVKQKSVSPLFRSLVFRWEKMSGEKNAFDMYLIECHPFYYSLIWTVFGHRFSLVKSFIHTFNRKYNAKLVRPFTMVLKNIIDFVRYIVDFDFFNSQKPLYLRCATATIFGFGIKHTTLFLNHFSMIRIHFFFNRCRSETKFGIETFAVLSAAIFSISYTIVIASISLKKIERIVYIWWFHTISDKCLWTMCVDLEK